MALVIVVLPLLNAVVADDAFVVDDDDDGDVDWLPLPRVAAVVVAATAIAEIENILELEHEQLLRELEIDDCSNGSVVVELAVVPTQVVIPSMRMMQLTMKVMKRMVVMMLSVAMIHVYENVFDEYDSYVVDAAEYVDAD